MKRRIVAAMLAAVVAVSMIGCGSTADTSTDTTGSAGSESAGGAETASADVADWPVVSMQAVTLSGDPTDEAEVEAALNTHLQEIDAGVQIDLIPITPGNTATTLQLMLTGGDDPIDLYNWRWWSSITGVVRNDQALNLDQYKDEYAELWDIAGDEIMKTQQVGGSTYAFPTMDGFCTEGQYVLRKDIAEEIGVADREGDYLTLDELNDILVKAKEAHPEYAYMFDTENQSNLLNVDYFGDTNYVGVLKNNGADNTTLVNYYEMDEFEDLCKMIKSWADAGMFPEDPLNNSYSISDMNDGVIAGFFAGSYSVDNLKQSITYVNDDVVVFQVSDLVSTSVSVGGGWCVSTVSEHPDAAMKMLSLFLTDSYMMNTLSHGIEGVHYVVDENGCAQYADGIDANYTGWTLNADWFYPNRYLTYPFDMDNPDYFTEMKTVRTSATPSEALGFTFDTSQCYDQYTAVANVVGEYKKALLVGEVDVDTYLTEFREELKNAGIDEVIAEEQRQLDEWKAQ